MNYIWELLIRAKQAGLKAEEVRFAAAETFSPYMELSLPTLNPAVPETEAEINPYYRFHYLFDELCDPGNGEAEELRAALFDIVVHFLAEMDVRQGMGKREWYIRFVIADIERGAYGSRAKERFGLFGREERDLIARQLLRLYETGEGVPLWQETMKSLFPRSLIYSNTGSRGEMLLYLGMPEEEGLWDKIALLEELFLPLSCHVGVYWNDHIGVIGVDETMRLDEAVLY